MEIQYKATVWCSVVLDESKITKEEVIEKLNGGLSPNEIGFSEDINSEWVILDDTESYITPGENGGEATIELMEYQEGKLGLQNIWDNSLKNKKDE